MTNNGYAAARNGSIVGMRKGGRNKSKKLRGGVGRNKSRLTTSIEGAGSATKTK